jgi:acyl dehydratase
MNNPLARPMRGLHWEDFNPGARFESGSRAITEADVVAFASFSGDWNPIHLDEEFARTTPIGKRIAHGILGMAIASGLGDREGILEGTILAFLSMEWTFKAPIFIGDSIRQRRTVLEKMETSKPSQGLLKFKVEVLNHRNEIVQEGIRTILLKRRPGNA